jgi:tetratricopeptide (TPR) repeat protein
MVDNIQQQIDSMNGQVVQLYRQGWYEQALALATRVRDVVRQALGEAHPDTATSLNNLALLYDVIGNYAAAEPLYREALAVQRQALGEVHPDTATSLHNLAWLYHAMGNYAAAEPLLRQALAVQRQALGEAHPHYAASLHNLAGLYHAMGNYAAAEPLYREALAVQRQVLGEAHPDYAGSLNNLAGLCAATAREAEALALMERAARIDERMIGQVFSIGSESQRMTYLRAIEGNLHGFLSLVVQHFPQDPAAIRTALDIVLRRKALGAEALAAQRDAVLSGRYPALAPRLRELTTLRMQIAQKTLAGPGKEGPQAHRRLLAEWNARKEGLESDLARQVPEMNLEQRLRAVDCEAVACALRDGVALIEFVRFDALDFKAVPARGERHWKPARYLTFVLPAGEPDQVRMIDLGEAAFIDRRIAAFRPRRRSPWRGARPRGGVLRPEPGLGPVPG